MILTLAVIIVNGYALINLFSIISKENSSANNKYDFNQPKSISGNIGTEKTSVFFKKGDVIQDGSKKYITDNDNEKVIPVKNRHIATGNAGNSELPIALQNNTHGASASRNFSAKEITGTNIEDYVVFKALESNNKLNQVRLTAIGSQYAYNMSKTSLSEPSPTEAGANGGGMQKVDDNPGGYNDVPVGSGYFTVFLMFVFFYITYIIRYRKMDIENKKIKLVNQ